MPANVLSREHMARIVEILRAHGVTRAAVFGSFARGAANDQSDVDILVEFAGAKGLLDLADLELNLGDLLGRDVEVITYRALNPRIRERVLRDQVPIL
jgi:hypothetical protein